MFSLIIELENLNEDRDHLQHIGFKLGFVEAIDIPMKKFKELVEKAFAEPVKEEPVKEEKEQVEEKVEEETPTK